MASLDDIGPELKVSATPSRKRKRGSASPSLSSNVAAIEKPSNQGEASDFHGQQAGSGICTDNRRLAEGQGQTQFHSALTDNSIVPDALGSLSPRAAAACQLSYLSINESVVDSGSEGSGPTTDKTHARPSTPDLPTFRFTEQGFPKSENTPPAKRILPPRAIKSPRPRFRSSPYSPPKPPCPDKADVAEKMTSDFTFDLRSLTWQDSEITGHLLLDSDDDGEGINGIGFKPTPAMALERSERRKRQVLEWRSRQAQDEREKRAEKRRRAHAMYGTEMQGRNPMPKKVVRFAV